jgi:hypothetical protein
MIQEINASLTKIIEQKRLKEKLERDLQAIEMEYQDRSALLKTLSTQLEKEKVDVEKLERTSLTSLYYSVLGSREGKLEKERQEMLSIRLQFQQMKHHVDYLEREIDRLLHQLDNLRDVDSMYEQLLSQKEKILRQSNQSVARELVSLSERITNGLSDLKEISEAVSAGKDVISGLDLVIESLEEAKGWGTFDLVGGGLISSAIKHSKIDDARGLVYGVQTKMSQFERELADVKNNIDIEINIGGFESFADFFLDGLIIDWIVQSKIVESLEKSRRAKKRIAKAVTELEEQGNILQNKIFEHQEKRAQLIKIS